MRLSILKEETNMLTVEESPTGLRSCRRRHRQLSRSLGGTRSTADSLINQSRWYDPSVGRWLSEDPSGLNAGPNPYEYCGNGPTDWDGTRAGFSRRILEFPGIWLVYGICHR